MMVGEKQESWMSKVIHTDKPSSRKISLVACKMPVYFEVPYKSLFSKAHEDVGSIWTWNQPPKIKFS